MDETAGLVDDEEVERCHLARLAHLATLLLAGLAGVESEQVVSPR